MQDNRLSPAGIVTLVILFGLLAGAIAYAVHAWQAMDGVQMSVLGWIFLGLGIVITFLVGAGLMALVFYSSRKNFDQ
ncbi:MAG: hypothetical protein H6924_08615 [Alphaproteobacteria bacterium]|nr:hypothetical protein [Alphaproteobacteria bacterium]